MSTVTRHYEHGYLELHGGNCWWIYIQTDQDVEFLGIASTLKEAEEMYHLWWED